MSLLAESRFVVLALLAVGCGPRTLRVAAEPDDVVVYVTHSGSNVRSVGTGASQYELDVGEGLSAAVFVVRAQDLVDLDGRPLPADFRPAVTADLTLGSCPCVAPESRPRVVAPGERCPLPPFAEVVSEQPVPPELGSKIALEWPGECPCTIPGHGLPTTVLGEATPLSGSWPPLRVDASDQGDLLLGRGFSIRSISDSERIVEPDAGLIDRIAAVPGGVAWTKQLFDLSPYEQSLEVAYDDGRRVSTVPPFRVLSMTSYSGGFLIGGSNLSRSPVLMACRSAELDGCVSMITPEMGLVDDALQELQDIAPGLVIARGSVSAMFVDGLPPAEQLTGAVVEQATPDADAYGHLTTTSSSAPRFRWMRNYKVRFNIYGSATYGISDTHVFYCIDVNTERGYVAHVYSAPRADFFHSSDVLDLTLLHRSDSAGCWQMARGPGGRVLIPLEREFISCSGTECRLLASPPALQHSHGAAFIVEGPAGFLRGENFEPITGSAPRAPIVDILTVGSDFWGFSMDGTLSRSDGRSLEQWPLTLPGPLTAAIVDRRDDRVRLFGTDETGCGPWTQRLSLTDRRLDGPPVSLDALGCDFIHAVAEAAPGKLLAATPTRLWAVSDDSLEEVAVDPDDPTTVEREQTIPVCGRKLDLWPGIQFGWHAVSGGYGAALASGCRPYFVRINFLVTPPKVEKVSLSRDDLIAVREAPVGALDASCGSVGSLGFRLGSRNVREVGAVARLTPMSFDRSEAGFLEPSLSRDDSNLNAVRSLWLDSDDPLDLVGGEHPVMLFHRSAHVVGSRARAYLPGYSGMAVAAVGSGGVMLGSRRGNLVFIELTEAR